MGEQSSGGSSIPPLEQKPSALSDGVNPQNYGGQQPMSATSKMYHPTNSQELDEDERKALQNTDPNMTGGASRSQFVDANNPNGQNTNGVVIQDLDRDDMTQLPYPTLNPDGQTSSMAPLVQSEPVPGQSISSAQQQQDSNLPQVCFVRNPNGGYSLVPQPGTTNLTDNPQMHGMAPDMEALEMCMRQQGQFRRNGGQNRGFNGQGQMMQGTPPGQGFQNPMVPIGQIGPGGGLMPGGMFGQGPGQRGMVQFLPPPPLQMNPGMMMPPNGMMMGSPPPGILSGSRLPCPPGQGGIMNGPMVDMDPMMMMGGPQMNGVPNNFQDCIPQAMDCYLIQQSVPPQERNRPSKIFDPLSMQNRCPPQIPRSQMMNIQLPMMDEMMQQQSQPCPNNEQRITLIREVYHFKKSPRTCSSKRQVVDCCPKSSITSCERPPWTNAYGYTKPNSNCARRCKTIPKEMAESFSPMNNCPLSKPRQDCCCQKRVKCPTGQVFIEKPRGCKAPTTLVREFVLSGRPLKSNNFNNENNCQVAAVITTVPPNCLFKGNNQLTNNIQTDLQTLLSRGSVNGGRGSQSQNRASISSVNQNVVESEDEEEVEDKPLKKRVSTTPSKHGKRESVEFESTRKKSSIKRHSSGSADST